MFKKKPKEPVSFYNEKYDKVKRYLPRLFLDLKFVKELNLDLKTMDLKVIYTNSTIIPIFIADNVNLQPYLKLGPTELEESEGSDMSVFKGMTVIGYKHFDRCKLPNGAMMGDLQSDLDKDFLASKRMKKFIQRRILGWKYWVYKLVGKV